MAQEQLERGLKIFYDEMEARMDDLSPAEQQQYLEGVVHVLDALTRYGTLGTGVNFLTPFEREQYISSVKSWAYSVTHDRNLDPAKHMRLLVETDAVGVARSKQNAADLGDLMGARLNWPQKLDLQNALCRERIK